MAQVKDFVLKVLGEINTVVERREAAGKNDADLDVLLRYESLWSFQDLTKKLQAMAADDREISVESLQFLLDFLQGRELLVTRSDGILNHHPKSLINVSCSIVAKNLLEALKGDNIGKHYYEVIDRNLHCSDYVTSKGDLSALEPHEFFRGDNMEPIETLVCLEKYREKMVAKGKQILPFHVCLPANAVDANRDLTPTETIRLLSHSTHAQKYYQAITAIPAKTVEELEFYKKQLHDAVNSEDFTPHYTYNVVSKTHKDYDPKKAKSNVNLLQNGFLAKVGITDLQTFAKVMTTVDQDDWEAFVEAIGDQFFDEVVLPKKLEKQSSGTVLKMVIPQHEDGTQDKENARYILQRPDKSEISLLQKDDMAKTGKKLLYTPDGALVLQSPSDKSISLFKPDASVLEPGKFAAFVDSPLYEKDRESVFNKALLFLITARYYRKILHEPDGIGGVPKETKKSAALQLMKHFANKNTHINQIVSSIDSDSSKLVEAIKREGDRLECIYKKALSLGPGLNESAQHLARFGEMLSSTPGNQWLDIITRLPNFEKIMRLYVDSCGDMIKCIKGQKYLPKQDKYNRAILFMITQFYIITRMKKGDTTGYGGYKKGDKIPAAEALRDFFCSEWPLNDLEGYLAHMQKPELLPVIRDVMNKYASIFKITEPSVLAALEKQAVKVCNPEYHLKQKVAAASLAK